MELNTQRGQVNGPKLYIGGSIKYPEHTIPTSGISVIDLINAWWIY